MKKKLVFFITLIFILYVFTGCTYFNQPSIFGKKDKDIKPNTDDIKGKGIDPDPKPIEVNIMLYFKHQTADLLVPEERKVQKDKQSIEQLVVEELLKGPRKFERVLVMPQDVKILDVTRKGNTVFVNLSSEFKKPVDLSIIPGKENIPKEEEVKTLAEMKRLAIYSIVNSLTDLEGGLQVKILVDNKQLTYEEMGAELLLEGQPSIDKKTPMTAISREKKFILNPSDAVKYVIEGLSGKPNWDLVYPFLATKMADDSTLPKLDELKRLTSAVGVTIESEESPINQEEIKPNGSTAFVTASYTIKYPNGKKEVKDKDVITVVREEGIWKVRLPEFFVKFE